MGRARVAIANGTCRGRRSLEQVVDRFPEPGALALLGEVLAVLGRIDEADDAYDTVAFAQLQEEAGAMVDLELARVAADHSDADHAVSLAGSAYQDHPVFAAEVLGWALHLSGSSPEAKAFKMRLCSCMRPPSLKRNGDASRAAELREQGSVVDPWYRALHPELTHWLLDSFTIPLGFRGDLIRRLRRP